MRPVKTVAFLAFSILVIANAKACRCIGVRSFSEVCKSSDLVAFVRVLDYQDYMRRYGDSIPTAVLAKVICLHAGHVNSRLIKIAIGNGYNCSQTIKGHLLLNKYWIVALFKVHDGYSFGGCGISMINITIWIYLLWLILPVVAAFIFRRYRKRRV